MTVNIWLRACSLNNVPAFKFIFDAHTSIWCIRVFAAIFDDDGEFGGYAQHPETSGEIRAPKCIWRQRQIFIRLNVRMADMFSVQLAWEAPLQIESIQLWLNSKKRLEPMRWHSFPRLQRVLKDSVAPKTIGVPPATNVSSKYSTQQAWQFLHQINNTKTHPHNHRTRPHNQRHI